MRVITVCGSVLSLLILISCQKVITKTLSKDLGVDERGCLALKSPSWQSALGQTDTTFASNGLQSFSGTGNGATGVYVQNDGNILSVSPLDNMNVALFKFLSNGQLDLSFGNSGRAADPVGSVVFIAPVDVISDCSNNIYVAAIVRVNNSGNQFGIGKYLPNGQFDQNFGNQGIAFNLNESTHDFTPYKILMQKDGKFVVIGTRQVLTTSPFDIAAARFNYDGQVDNTFGTNGIMSFAVTDTDIFDGAILPDNRIVLVGRQQNSCAIFRLNSNGSLDNTFANSGLATLNFTNNLSNYSSCTAVRRFANQSSLIVLGESSEGGTPDFGVAKVLENGNVDSSFNGGKFTIDFGFQDYANTVRFDFDQKIYVSGRSTIGSTQDRISVARLNSNGTPDSTFGISGKFFYNFPTTTNPRAMAIAPSGKIVFTGLQNTGGGLFMLSQTK